jgi:hypothetical protein
MKSLADFVKECSQWSDEFLLQQFALGPTVYVAPEYFEAIRAERSRRGLSAAHSSLPSPLPAGAHLWRVTADNAAASSVGVKIIFYLVGLAILWLVWRPLGAVFLVFALRNVKLLAARNALLWRPKDAVAFGWIVGPVVALLTQLATRFAFSSPYAAVAMVVFGFYPVVYIGHGVPRGRLFRSGSDRLRLAARGAAVVAYVLATGLALAWAFTHGWYSA